MEARTVSFQRYTRLGKQPRADGEKTREAILDAAEYLFSFGGLDGVSIRQITKAARTDLGSVNYYFGSKKLLFNAVLVRRVARMTEQRLESLSSLALVPGQPESVRAVLFRSNRVLHSVIDAGDSLGRKREVKYDRATLHAKC